MRCSEEKGHRRNQCLNHSKPKKALTFLTTRELDNKSERRNQGSVLLGLQEPLVEASVGGSPVKLLVDTGAEDSDFKNSDGAVCQ